MHVMAGGVCIRVDVRYTYQKDTHASADNKHFYIEIMRPGSYSKTVYFETKEARDWAMDEIASALGAKRMI